MNKIIKRILMVTLAAVFLCSLVLTFPIGVSAIEDTAQAEQAEQAQEDEAQAEQAEQAQEDVSLEDDSSIPGDDEIPAEPQDGEGNTDENSDDSKAQDEAPVDAPVQKK